MFLNWSSWQLLQVSDPTYVEPLVGSAKFRGAAGFAAEPCAQAASTPHHRIIHANTANLRSCFFAWRRKIVVPSGLGPESRLQSITDFLLARKLPLKLRIRVDDS